MTTNTYNLPWTIAEQDISIRDNKGGLVCDVELRSDGVFITHCVNNHDALVSSLQELVDMLGEDWQLIAEYQKAKAALKAARGCKMTYLSKQDGFNGFEIIDDRDNKTVATISGATDDFLALALAAPDMLAALEQTLRCLQDTGEDDMFGAAALERLIEQAITKAKGEV